MRSKSASAPCTSTCTLSSWPSGKKRRGLERREGHDVADRRGARVALDGEHAREPVHERGHDAEDRAHDHEEPAADHASARSWQRASLAFAARKRRTDSSCCPNVLASRMPLTDSVSSVMAETSASDFWVSSLTLRGAPCPTR